MVRLRPPALCEFMQQRGVRYFSITDHDSIKAYGQFTAPGHIRAISGIEINTTFRDGEVHILGYRLPLGALSSLHRGAGRKPSGTA